MVKDVDWNVDEIDSKDYDLSQLPDNPNCPILVKLFLQVPGLTVIPPTFFECMPVLEVLDLSNTNIVSLPSSISSLSLLQEFFLRDCSALIELPSQIGMLTNLKLFDIKGTEIMYIPKEMRDVKNLEVLRVSLSRYAKDYIKTKHVNEDVIIPRKMISELKNLKELCICVRPEAEWWKEEVNDIQIELCDLEKLETLQWYLPTNNVLLDFLHLKRKHSPMAMHANILNLMLTIGQHAQLTSCLPRGYEKKFEEFKNYLKWINAEGNMDDISEIIAQAETLFLSRHWTVKKLSSLNIKKLKYCLLAECNEMETLVEGDELSNDVGTRIDAENVGLGLLEYLSIHYMKELKRICKGPIGKGNLSKLTILALHTCPKLNTIFTPDMIQNLSCLIEITVEDCPSLESLISNESPIIGCVRIFTRLERIFLLDLPALVCIFSGQIILEKLDSLLIYSCRKFCSLSTIELPNIQKINGENGWWNALEDDKSKWESVFEPLKEKEDLLKQLSEATNSLQHFHDIASPAEAKDEKPLDGSGLGAHTSNFPFGQESQPGLEYLRIPLEAIRLATNNFSDANLISLGTFGRVYKGQIVYKGEQSMAAIKRLRWLSRVGRKEFQNEIMMLSRFNHTNLVSILGFCDADDEKILMYEYMTKGSLDNHIRDFDLTWIQRLKICIGVARGLEYLHGTKGVIHRDIKSSNILLDYDWNAKISDFGLAIFRAVDPLLTYSIPKFVGSVGYVDPSYSKTGFLTKESDIYSFGVVLFEVLCGRLYFTDYYSGDEGLTMLVEKHYKEKKLDAIIHDGLRDQISAESLEKFSAIVYKCLSENPKERPPASVIAAELEIALLSQEFENSKSRRLITIYDEKDAVDDEQKNQHHSPTRSADLQIFKGVELSGRKDVISEGSMKDGLTQSGHVNPAQETMEKGKAQMIVQVIEDDITGEGITKGLEHLRIPLEEIRLATQNFRYHNVIGFGGLGTVYKGRLVYKGGQSMVAIQLLHWDDIVGRKEFLSEIMMLAGFEHVNLVSLIGYCDEDGQNILVYEYMAKGSLDNHLSHFDFTWTQRLKICIGVAHGLAYLHRTRLVIQGDIKSSNILLDDDWNAKISDFGLARSRPVNQMSTSFNPFRLSVNDFVYLDPFYLKTGVLTKESDIYSFGVVLFEVLCDGRSFMDSNGADGRQTKLVKKHYKEKKLNAIIHDGLRDQISAESLKKFSAIAYKCLSKDPKKRPSAPEIVAELEIALLSQEPESSKSQIYDKKDAVDNKQTNQHQSPTGSTFIQFFKGIFKWRRRLH